MVDRALASPVSECTLEGKICVLADGIKLLKQYAKARGLPDGKPSEIIRNTMRHLDLLSESAIWEHEDVRKVLGQANCRHILDHYYKQKGPAYSTNLLSNLDIDGVLERWAKFSQVLFKKKFHHISYQMIDFDQQGTELAYLNLVDLKKNGVDIWAVVMNTDPSYKSGEHWFCLVGDLQHEGTETDPWVLEYFNSSGNPYHCYPSLQAWINRLVHSLLRDEQKSLKVHTSIPRELQKSHTECGVWCLSYIHSRLAGKPPDWFYKSGLSDEEMYEYRKHLFRDVHPESQ